MRYVPKALVLATILAVQLAFGAAFGAVTLTDVYSGRIPPGVYIGSLSVGGLDLSSLSATAKNIFPAGSAGLRLVLDGTEKKWVIPYDNLKPHPNLPLVLASVAVRLDNGSPQAALDILRLLGRPVHLTAGFLYQSSLLAEQLAVINREVAVPAQNASLTLTGGKVTLVPSEPGRELNIAATLAAVGPLLPTSGDHANLVFTTTAPEIGDKQLVPLKQLLASFHTDIVPGQTARNHNLRLAAQILNGTLIEPGQVFSLNAQLGKRTRADGFRRAPAIVNDTLVNQTGGGICQIATTLYNAALRAGLSIVERYPHSLPIPYAPLGMDATLNWDNLDLKLADKSTYPVYITAQVLNDRLTVQIFGERTQPEQVLVYTKIQSLTGLPIPPKYQLLLGAGGPNTIRVSLYRRISSPGQESTQLISQDYYHTATNLPPEEK